MDEYTTLEKPQWCPGCGNYAILMAIKSALFELKIPPHQTVIVTGIGCSGKINHYINTYGFEALHGRAVPVACGIKLANHELKVIAEGGDGDGYGIGSAHFLHVMRRNIDITYIVHDNSIYGLTTGQTSPTSLKGFKSKSTPNGNLEIPLNPIAIAIANGATFVSRAFAGEMQHMKEVIKQALQHKGFSLVSILQPCVTFNKLNTYSWWQQRVYKLESINHNFRDRYAAFQKALEEVETNYSKIPIGIFYKEDRLTYEEEAPQLKNVPLYKHEINLKAIESALEEFY